MVLIVIINGETEAQEGGHLPTTTIEASAHKAKNGWVQIQVDTISSARKRGADLRALGFHELCLADSLSSLLLLMKFLRSVKD